MESAITFRALSESDLPLMQDWLSRPHVTEWWEPAPTFEEVREDYLPRLAPRSVLPLDAPAGVVQYLAYEAGVPFAFVQAYRVMAHQAERLGQGLGTRMLQAFVAFLFQDPRVSRIQTDPTPTNARAIACYRKVGFRDVGVVETLDGPALLMRLTRDAAPHHLR